MWENFQIKMNTVYIAGYFEQERMNDWFSANAPLSWGIYRNVPFALISEQLFLVVFYE